MNEDSDAQLLRKAWFQAQGVKECGLGVIHPSDDMARPDVQMVDPGYELAHYAKSGYEGFTVLRHLLRSAGRELHGLPSFLDFAGGYGRIMRFFAAELAPNRIWASDVLQPAVEFVKETFGVHGFVSTTASEELEIPRRFDVIWVASLFSHLPRETFVGFLEKLYGALEPDGLLVFSTHTPGVLRGEDRSADGFTFQLASESRVLDFGDYGSTFVEPTLVHELGRKAGIAHLYGLEREIWRIQDLYVASPSEQSELDKWKPAAVAHGTIVEARVSDEGHAWIGGFVRVPEHEAPIRGVTLILGDSLPGEGQNAAIRPLEEALPSMEGGDRFRQTDWYLEGPVPELLQARKTLCAVVEMKSGAKWCFDATWLGRKPRAEA